MVGRYVPTNVIHVRNKDKPRVDDQCRHVFGLKQGIHHWYTRNRSRVNLEEFVRCQVRANETYSEAKRQFKDRNGDILMNVHPPHKWWSTLKSAVFGSSSSLPLLLSQGGGLVCEWVGKVDLLLDGLMACSPLRLLICRSLANCLLVLPPLHSGRVR